MARPGSVIELAAGTFELSLPLSLDADRVTLRGQGMDETILSFKGQETGGEGLLVTSDGAVLEDFRVQDTPGDGIKVKGAEGITLRRVGATWTGGPQTENGAYGLYPVKCRNVLVEACWASNASDAGIYVGQSENVIVRHNKADHNVAGIEIENSRRVDVYGNTASKNTGGILVFDLPDLPVQGGGHVRVFDNRVLENDTPNFAAKGTTVALVPRGTGVLVMANRGVEIFENSIGGHPTANIIIASYLATGLEIKDRTYNPFPEAIHIHHNNFGPGGDEPSGMLGETAAAVGGVPLPDIVWDGAVNPEALVDGKLPAERRFSIHDNGDAGFVNLDLITAKIAPESARVRRELGDHAGDLAALSAVEIPGVQ